MKEYARSALQAAEQALRLGDAQRAEALLRQVLERDPAQAETIYALARIALQGDRTAEAVELLRAALKRNPGVPQLHADLAVALQNLGQHEAATTEARHALSLEARHLPAL